MSAYSGIFPAHVFKLQISPARKIGTTMLLEGLFNCLAVIIDSIHPGYPANCGICHPGADGRQRGLYGDALLHIESVNQ